MLRMIFFQKLRLIVYLIIEFFNLLEVLIFEDVYYVDLKTQKPIKIII